MHPKLVSFFEQHQYTWFPQQLQFRKPTAFGFLNVVIAPSQTESYQQLHVTFGAHVHRVEDLIQPYIQEFHGSTHTRNTTISSLSKLQPKRSNLYRFQQQLPLADIQEDLAAFIFPFLQPQEDLHFIAAALNTQPLQQTHYSYNERHRCFRGLALALETAPAEVEKLSIAYAEYLKQQVAPEFTRNAFKAFSRYVNQLAVQQN